MSEVTGYNWRNEKVVFTTREHYARQAGFFGLILCMAGLVTSPALLSIGTVLIILPGFAAVPLKEQLRRFWDHKPAFFLSFILIIQILSGLWTREEAINIWLEQVKIKAPLFFALYSLAVLGPFSLKQVRIALAILLFSVVLVGTGTVIDYFLNIDEIEHRIQTSKELQVWLGTNHIYFSIVSAFSCLASVWLYRFRDPLFWKGERVLFLVLGILNFLIMHVLTTRTGLVGLYLTGGILGFIYIIRRRKYLLGILGLVILLGMPVAGYYGVGSFRHRVDNTKMDVTRYFAGKDPNYLSIGSRFESYKTAFNLFLNYPMIGVGMADLRADMTDQYVEDETLLCPENFLLPHNQFLRNLAGFGLLGFLTFSFAWFYTPFFRRKGRGWLFSAFWILFTFSMMAEATIERQVGVMFMVCTLMLTLGLRKQAENPEA